VAGYTDEEVMSEFTLEPVRVLSLSILVLWLGTFVESKIGFLKRYNIPSAVTGGLLCSIAVALLTVFADVRVTFDLAMRDTLLLVFFSTIGLSAKLSRLAAGGKALATLLAITIVFLLFQNIGGILVAKLFGADPRYGLLAGSISFAGGHGTAITWGTLMGEDGALPGAIEIGLACATFGLILGGVIGGPIANRLMMKNNLTGDVKQDSFLPSPDHASKHVPVTVEGMLGSLFLLAICIGSGATVNTFVTSQGLKVPGFLTAMGVGILLTNVMDMLGRDIDKDSVGFVSDLSLQLFLSMSLMSMQLLSLTQALGPLLLVMSVQVFIMGCFAYYIVFPALGRDYDASVIAAGFAGLGLGATPVGIANMHAVTSRFGASPKAFLVVPLVGAFFLDIANAAIIQFFLSTPLLQ
jgi:ESS family glutamate:Na+ symporter